MSMFERFPVQILSHMWETRLRAWDLLPKRRVGPTAESSTGTIWVLGVVFGRN